MKKIIAIAGLLVFAVLLVAFSNNVGKSNAGDGTELTKAKEENSQQNDFQTGVLTIKKDKSNSDFPNQSNMNLYTAHLMSGVITLNVAFNNGGELIDEKMIRSELKNIQAKLRQINYNGEKAEKIQQAKDLADKAYKRNVKLGDPILEKLHSIIHDLNAYFNGEFDDVEVDKTGIPIHEEDRIPHYDYSER